MRRLNDTAADALGFAVIIAVFLAFWIATPAKSEPLLRGTEAAQSHDFSARKRKARAAHSFSWGGGSALISEAQRWIGKGAAALGVRRNLWCVAAINKWLVNIGKRSTGTESARALLRLGRRVPGPRVGAIAVLSRGKGGHAGIVQGVDSNGNPILISGNHGNRVAVATYPASRVLGYVMF